MVKVTMPLLSAGASGTFIKNFPFSQRKTCQIIRYQKSQKDKSTPAREAQRTRFKQAKEMWLLNDLGVIECGFNMLGGKATNLSALPLEKRAPLFARWVSDYMNFYN